MRRMQKPLRTKDSPFYMSDSLSARTRGRAPPRTQTRGHQSSPTTENRDILYMMHIASILQGSTRNFRLQVFVHGSVFPRPPEIPIGAILNFTKICGDIRNLRLSEAVLRIHDILVWIRIRIRGSMPLTKESGSGCRSGSFYFHH